MKNPVKNPKRILLRGFADRERTDMADWIRNNGMEVIQLASLADLVVTGPDASPELLQHANLNGTRFVAWDEFRAMLDLKAAAPFSSAEPGEPQAREAVAESSDSSAARSVPVEVTQRGVRVLDVWVPLAKADPADVARIPAADRFLHLCMDAPFLETLRSVALAVSHGMPVALEGETAASKTTAVLYLAHLLGQPVVRMNLSGQTDASELVGRYVPMDAAGALDWEGLAFPWLRKETRAVLEHAHREGRSLNPAERMAVLGREQFPLSSWRFQEGCLPQAMRRGWWLLLDELNLAETQVLERLNCALENPPGLVLTEGDGTVFGPGGDVPVHPGFRLVATLNPSEYAGRAVLSQAFMDRWSVWHQSESPGEREIGQMLRFLVFGEQPRVNAAGSVYRAPAAVPVYGELQQIPEIGSLLQRLAVFHHGIFKAAGGGGATASIGRLNRERYSFSRRVLLNLVAHVAARIRSGESAREQLVSEAIRTFYLGRLKGEADRRAVHNILRAGGLL